MSFFPKILIILYCFSVLHCAEEVVNDPQRIGTPLVDHDSPAYSDDESEDLRGEFNVEKAKGLLKKAYPKIRSTEGEEVVLVLGNTGSGKSTIINRLLGCQMQKTLDGAKCIAKPIDESQIYAKIGTGWDSETLFPEVHKSRDGYSTWTYCDCPGFEDIAYSK
jgi:hypothetical protein